MKIAIRADGNANIGLGHIQRCLTLSSQLKKKGAKVIFVVKEDKIVKEKVKQEGFEVIELEHNLNLDKDLRYIVKTIKENKIDILITDSYEFDEKYLIEVKKNVALLVSIDDLAEIAFPSDILINQNIYAKELSYRSLTAKTEFLLGPEYALLKEEFIQSNSRTFQCAKRRMNEKVKNILITLGGSDIFNLTPKILHILCKIKEDFKITVVVGPFFNNISRIKEISSKTDKGVKFIYNSPQMAKLMFEAGLVITGGGSTLHELAATGTPACAFCLADNQERNIKGMERYGAIINLGWWNEFKEERVCNEVMRLLKTPYLREEMSKKGQELVDGRGVERVIKSIFEEYQRI